MSRRDFGRDRGGGRGGRDRDRGGRGPGGDSRGDRRYDNRNDRGGMITEPPTDDIQIVEERGRSGKGGGGGGDVGDRKSSSRFNEESSGAAKKSTAGGRSRLFVGSIHPECKEADIRKLFEQYGEVSECYVSSRGFGFVRMATRAQAETAKEKLDNHTLKGRPLKIRHAAHGASVKVKELNPFVSNELLEEAFQRFGPVERAIHIVDDKGRPTGDGIIEFEQKRSAIEALNQIQKGVFLMTCSPHPIQAEALDVKDDEDGLLDRMIPSTMTKQKQREQLPRFAREGSFEYDFGRRWQELYKMEKVRREQLEHEFREARERLEADQDLAYQEYQAQQMREELRRRQMELEQLEAQRRERMEMLRKRDEEMRAARGGRGGPPPFGQEYGQDYGQDAPFSAPGQQGRPGPAAGGNRRDDHLVSGVQKLLQMFKGDEQNAAAQEGDLSRQPPGYAPGQPDFSQQPPNQWMNAPPPDMYGQQQQFGGPGPQYGQPPMSQAQQGWGQQQQYFDPNQQPFNMMPPPPLEQAHQQEYGGPGGKRQRRY